MLFVAPKKSQKHDKLLIIGDEKDQKEIASLSKMGFCIYTKELILSAILKQELNLEDYKFKNSVLQ
jgi:hypothetical protein